MGQIKKYKTGQELSEAIDKYFDTVPVNEQTRAGLFVFLGITKPTWYSYEKQEEFREVIEFATLRLESKYELQLNEKSRPGDIFALKQYGWTDKQEVENKMSGGVQIISSIPRPEASD